MKIIKQEENKIKRKQEGTKFKKTRKEENKRKEEIR